MALAARIAERPATGIKRFQPVLVSAKARDANESDTSMIVTDVLADVFGYDKYSEARKKVARSAGKTLRARKEPDAPAESEPTPEETQQPAEPPTPKA